MTREGEKKVHHATCKHCGKVTDISMSKAVRRLVVLYKTFKEKSSECERKCTTLRASKNGEIQQLHKTLKLMLDIMTPEQRKQAREFYKKKFI